MYKHRPAFPALIAAFCVLALGGLVSFYLNERVEAGEGSMLSVLLVGCLSCGIAGVLFIAAFARYQFSHLWNSPDPAFSKKARRKRDLGKF